ncbi:MAG: hypothetical protein ACE5NW_16815 [Acidiferrobacterales bacterium]
MPVDACNGLRVLHGITLLTIFGRDSIDIIETGGYKVSALDIEETLRTSPPA